jgi:hypothetical protein
MPYSTQDLLAILAQEMQATCQGQRILLTAGDRLNHAGVAKALNPQRLGGVFAYQDFRAEVHHYQLQHQISGLVWRTCQFRGGQIHRPELHPQLIALEQDKTVLMAFKDSLIEFWQQQTPGMNYWLLGSVPRLVSRASLILWRQETEWAELEASQSELFLSLCWGHPQQAAYEWAKPHSGRHLLVAAWGEPSGMRV